LRNSPTHSKRPPITSSIGRNFRCGIQSSGFHDNKTSHEKKEKLIGDFCEIVELSRKCLYFIWFNVITTLSQSLSFSLSLCLCFSQSVSLSVSIYLSIYRSLSLPISLNLCICILEIWKRTFIKKKIWSLNIEGSLKYKRWAIVQFKQHNLYYLF